MWSCKSNRSKGERNTLTGIRRGAVGGGAVLVLYVALLRWCVEERRIVAEESAGVEGSYHH